jgi:hypothetical protein
MLPVGDCSDDHAGGIDAGNGGAGGSGDVGLRKAAIVVDEPVYRVGIVGKLAVNHAGVGDAGNRGAVGEKDVDRCNDAVIVDEAVLPVGKVDIISISEDLPAWRYADDVGVARAGGIEGGAVAGTRNEAMKGERLRPG